MLAVRITAVILKTRMNGMFINDHSEQDVMVN